MKSVGFILLCIFFLVSILSTPLFSETMAKNDDLMITVKEVKYINRSLEINYVVKNISRDDIWVCISNNREKYPNFESKVLKRERRLIILIKSFIVPSDVFLEEPIFAKYQRLSSGKTKVFKLKIESPVHNFSPLNYDKSEHLDINKLKTIDIEIGYYKKLLNKDRECCMKTKNEEELLVNCFWAEKHKEKSISVQIAGQQRED